MAAACSAPCSQSGIRAGRRPTSQRRVGQALAFVFGFLGLIGGNPLLIFIAIFVYLAATAEAQMVGLQDVSRNLGVGDAMITRFEALGPQATIADAAELLLRTTQHEFPIVDGGGKLRGFLTRNAMIAALSKSGAATPVIDAMTADIRPSPPPRGSTPR